jgi:hypothetical protein
MKHLSKLVIALGLFGYGLATQAQNTVPATGSNASGTGGSVSYSVGQVVYTTNTGTNGTVSQGVQQPYEISIVTAVENTEGISIICIVYPNPTRGLLKLIVESFDYENLRFKVYNINGVLLQDKKVESRETEISMEDLQSSVYLLKVIKGNKEIKVFKIVKN